LASHRCAAATNFDRSGRVGNHNDRTLGLQRWNSQVPGAKGAFLPQWPPAAALVAAQADEALSLCENRNNMTIRVDKAFGGGAET
jgi:hypothetical protein